MPTESERRSMTHEVPQQGPTPPTLPQALDRFWNYQPPGYGGTLLELAHQALQPDVSTVLSLPDGGGSLAGSVLGAKAPVRTFHSSPHDFEKFDLSKMGTGEGAQIYGPGIYSAESPAVSGQGGQYWNNFMNRFGGAERAAAKRLQRLGFDREAAIENTRSNMETLKSNWERGSPPYYSPAEIRQHVQALEQQLRILESGKPVGPRTYELEIAKPEKMLDWDKPLENQPGDLGGIVRQLFPREDGALTVRQALSNLNYYFGNQMKTAEALRDVGIPGVKYLDQRSRDIPGRIDLLKRALDHYDFQQQAMGLKPNPAERSALAQDIERELKELQAKPLTRNYAIWDPDFMRIMKKYGILLPGTGGILGSIANQAANTSNEQAQQ